MLGICASQSASEVPVNYVHFLSTQVVGVADVPQHKVAPLSALKFLHVVLVPVNAEQWAVLLTHPTPLYTQSVKKAEQSASLVAVFKSAQVLSLHVPLTVAVAVSL